MPSCTGAAGAKSGTAPVMSDAVVAASPAPPNPFNQLPAFSYTPGIIAACNPVTKALSPIPFL